MRIDHAGVCAARNRGLERATGSVVAYVDDDNIMDPLWLMAVANTFDRHPELSLLYGARLIDDPTALRIRPSILMGLHYSPGVPFLCVALRNSHKLSPH